MPTSPSQPLVYDTLAVHSERAGFCVGHAGPLVVGVWTRTATPEHVDLVGTAQRDVLRSHSKFVVLSIVRAELSMSVDDEVRERSRSNVEEFGDNTVRSVLVIESGGLRASFFRSVITGVYYMTRSSAAQRVSSNIDEGLDWLFEPLLAGVDDAPTLDADAATRIHRDVRRFADDVAQRHPPA